MLRYKYLDYSDGALCVLSKGTIKFSPPEEFNDPFDCSPDFDPEKHGKYVSEHPELLKEAGNRLGLSPAERIMQKKRMVKRVVNAAKRGDYNSPVNSNIGICCLSRKALNLLMWAHYAQNHKGFVVEFEIPESGLLTKDYLNKKIFEWLIPLEVDYVEEKPLIDPYDDRDTNMTKNYLTKGMDWKYEEEERVLDYVRGEGIHRYERKKILKSVIAGMRMSNENYANLKCIIQSLNKELGTNVMLYKAKPIPGKYGLFVDGRSDIHA